MKTVLSEQTQMSAEPTFCSGPVPRSSTPRKMAICCVISRTANDSPKITARYRARAEEHHEGDPSHEVIWSESTLARAPKAVNEPAPQMRHEEFKPRAGRGAIIPHLIYARFRLARASWR